MSQKTRSGKPPAERDPVEEARSLREAMELRKRSARMVGGVLCTEREVIDYRARGPEKGVD